MVYYNLRSKLIRFRKRKPNQEFIDSVQLKVRGGPGGMGFPKFGGIGGKGGDVVLQAQEGCNLKEVYEKYSEKFIKAGKGKDSHDRCILGSKGSDHIITVPTGISVIDEDANRIMGQLDEGGQRLIAAKGGPGGCPETGYSGIRGESRSLKLDLKIIADIGLVGFPNAGKSTLLKAITNAKPKIASYPFTTIKPRIGVLNYPDARIITMADLPGLIEGAHKNIGMGSQFLRHCERTKLLLLIADIQGFQLNINHKKRSCLETVILLNKELELYRSYLTTKPALLLVNKMDTEGAWNTYNEIKDRLHNLKEAVKEFPPEIRPIRTLNFDEILPVSVKTSIEDVLNLKDTLRICLDIHAEEEGFTPAKIKFIVEEIESKQKEVGPQLI